MGDAKHCPAPRSGPGSSPDWQEGTRLTAAACTAQQNYRLRRLRHHNSQLHGWGVLCGLLVVPAADGAHPWAVRICPGYALGPCGEEVELTEPATLDIEEYLWFRPPTFSTVFRPSVAYVAVRYREWLDEPRAIAPAACTCSKTEYVDTRIVDGWQAGVVWTPPKESSIPDFCKPGSPPCPPVPDSAWIVLAAVTLPERGLPLTRASIDNGVRVNL